MTRVAAHLQICKKNQAHGCPICLGLKLDLVEIDLVKQRLKLCTADKRPELRELHDLLAKQIAFAQHHQATHQP